VVFGPHLTLDLYGCDKRRLSSEKFICKLLDEFPTMIDMHKITEPHLTYYPGRDGSFDNGGFSAFILIAESHISIHCFPDQRYASIDIFSCKEFDTEKAEALMMEAFNAKQSERNLFNRGSHFPKDIGKTRPIVGRQRKKIVEKK